VTISKPTMAQRAMAGAHPEYEILGHFEPRDGKRILKGLEEQHLSFEVQECNEIRFSGPRSSLYIYVRSEEKIARPHAFCVALSIWDSCFVDLPSCRLLRDTSLYGDRNRRQIAV
jgi:hypothetical protein